MFVFCSGCLLQANFTKVHKDFFVNYTCVEKDKSKYFLDVLDASSRQRWNGFWFSCILGLGTISDSIMAMR